MYTHVIKRIIDILLSFIGMVVLAIPMLLIALIIMIEDKGSPFFVQKRVGINKTHFNLYKFRSMKLSTPHDMPTHMLKDPEQYILKVGKFLRKYSLDELPQLLNILKGDISIIGPRPALWNQFDLIEERDKYGANDIKPGLTGWAQINGRDELEIPVKAKLDGEYAEKIGFLMDIKCFFLTFFKVLKHEGVKEGGTGSINMVSEKLVNNVAIVSPAYNAAEYIGETIESVQAQTYKDWEMYIVDDCSTDDTVKIVSSYAEKDNRIKLIKQQKNGGAAAARNTALDIINSKYIAFLDCDDKWLPEKLEKQVKLMDESNCALSYTYFREFDTHTGTLLKIIKAPKYMTYNRIFRNTAIGCLTVMVNREISGKFQMPLLKHTEDNCTWQAILKPGYKALLIPEVLSLYRCGNDSLTRSKRDAARDQWNYYRKFYKFSVIKSAWYFCFYAINAVKKHYF